MKKCPYCAEMIQDEAVKCRFCGEFLDSSRRVSMGPLFRGSYWGYEYKSKRQVWGIPLVHIAHGIDPQTGRLRVARGIIAIGNIAIGVLALGGIALGGLVMGGIGLGLFVFGGLSLGIVALGGLAIGLYLAIGGLAISGSYAIGGLALAPHAIGGNGVDPEFLNTLKKWWPGIDKIVPH